MDAPLGVDQQDAADPEGPGGFVPALRTGDQQGMGGSIGGGGVVVQDGDQTRPAGRPARAGVQDVVIGLTLIGEIALVIARGEDALVAGDLDDA